jgi:hypothetical protein
MRFNRLFRFGLFVLGILNAQRNLHFQITALQPELSRRHAIDVCNQLNLKGRAPTSNRGRPSVSGKTSASAL